MTEEEAINAWMLAQVYMTEDEARRAWPGPVIKEGTPMTCKVCRKTFLSGTPDMLKHFTCGQQFAESVDAMSTLMDRSDQD